MPEFNGRIFRWVMSRNPIRWGFCCASKIANDFSIALDNVGYAFHQKVAVAARDLKRAHDFSLEHKFEKFYGSYKELAEDEEVEIVYVSSLTPQHFEHCKLFLENGKHVLCEKPLTMELQHTVELISLAKERKLFFMEGFRSRFYPVYPHVKRHIDDGEIGEVRQIHAHFHKKTTAERLTLPELGGGAWYNIGVYCLNLVDYIFDSYPIQISSVSDRLSNGVDKDFVISLKYAGGKMALLSTSSTSSRPNSAFICGSIGYIELKAPFHCPTEYEIFKNGDPKPRKHTFELSTFRSEDYNYLNSDGFKYQIEHVRHCLRDLKTIESPVMTFEAIGRIARVTEELMTQMKSG